jgi:hypothetical protein
MARAPLRRVDIAIDVAFEPNDAFRATIAAAAQPLVLEQPRPTPMLPPSMRSVAPSIVAEPPSRTKLWPLAICAFIAFAFATVAFVKSPLAKHPRVAPYVDAAMAYAA